MAGSLLEVGELAERAGVCVQTLHYYERLGLLPKPDRSASNYRLYSAEALRRVQFIKKAQGLGFTLVEVKEILDLHDHGRAPCRQVADGNIAVLKVKIPSMDCAACAASIQAKL